MYIFFLTKEKTGSVKGTHPLLHEAVCPGLGSSRHSRLLGESRIQGFDLDEEDEGGRAESACGTYDVHERKQVLLDVLLPVELDHRVVHAQQDLDVVGPLHALSPHAARSGVVDALLHAAVQRLQVHQTAEVSACRGNRRRC